VPAQHAFVVRSAREPGGIAEHPVEERSRTAEKGEGRDGHPRLLAREKHGHPPDPLAVAVQLPAGELEGAELTERVGHRRNPDLGDLAVVEHRTVQFGCIAERGCMSLRPDQNLLPGSQYLGRRHPWAGQTSSGRWWRGCSGARPPKRTSTRRSTRLPARSRT